MSILEIFILAIGVSMDAFAISICKGITIKKNINKNALTVGLWFGLFQGLMPLIGFFLMGTINKYVQGVKEYIIFALLVYVGVSMIIEAKKEENFSDNVGFKEMFVLAIATSLDALSIGLTLSLLKINVLIAVSVIALTTFLFSYFGVKIGNKFGSKYKGKAEIIGGIILIIIGAKIMLEFLL